MTAPERIDPRIGEPATADARLAALDGLRALCIVAVTLLHAGYGTVVTGRIGVYVFFTLSGFLITTLLLRELTATGRVGLPAFYERRARRLLPALALVLAAVFVFAELDGASGDLWPSAGVVASIVFYVANWATIAEGVGGMGAFGHVWSLSVEEQFYVVWPLVVLALGRVRRGTALLLVVCGAGVAVSIVARELILRSPSPSLEHLLVGTDTNADHLLVGCALAIVLHGATARQRARVAALLRVAVVPAIGYFAYVLFVDRRTVLGAGPLELWFPGMQTGIAVASAVVIGHLVLRPRSWGARRLSVRPVAWLGEISYGWYLWHLPVLAVLRTHLEPYNRPVGLVLCCMVTLAVSTMSYVVIEDPIRRRGRRRQGSAAVALASAVD